MQRRIFSVPELLFIVGTRGMLGAGLGLLASQRLSGEQKLAIGWTLVAIGAITTIPAALTVLDPQRRIG